MGVDIPTISRISSKREFFLLVVRHSLLDSEEEVNGHQREASGVGKTSGGNDINSTCVRPHSSAVEFYHCLYGWRR